MGTVLAYLLALCIAHYYQYMAYSDFNTNKNTYMIARKVLLCVFFGGLLLVFFASDEFFELALKPSPRRIAGTPAFVLIGTAYAAMILMLDQNFRYSRRSGYESNFFKHSLIQFCFVMPFFVCFWLSKLTIGYLILVSVFGKNPRKNNA